MDRINEQELEASKKEEIRILKSKLQDTDFAALSVTALRILWERFSNIQEAFFLGVDDSGVKRFIVWLGTGDDFDAWS